MKSILLTLGVTSIFSVTSFWLGARYASQKPVGSEHEIVYAEVNGKPILGKDILAEIEPQLLEIKKSAYHLKKEATKKYILENLTQVDEPQDDFEVDVQSAEFKKWLSERNMTWNRLSPQAQSDAQGNFAQSMKIRALQLRQRDAYDSLEIKWHIPMDHWPRVESLFPSKLPALGDGSGSKRITLIANLHCGYCGQGLSTLQALRDRYQDDLKIDYRWILPEKQPETSEAFQIALKSYCAWKQSQFEAFMEKLLQPNSPGLPDANLDQEAFAQCLQSQNTVKELRSDLSQARLVSPAGEPVWIINGYIIPFAENMDSLVELLEN